MKESLIQKVQDILVNWDPIGERSVYVKDLDNYYIEVVDILCELNNKSPVSKIQKVVQEMLNEALDLSLTIEECSESATQIKNAIIEHGLD